MVPRYPIGSQFITPKKSQPTTFHDPFKVIDQLNRISRDMLTSPFHDAFDRFVDEFFGKSQSISDVIKNQGSYPKADGFLKDDHIFYRLAVPGIPKENIKVEFDEKESLLIVSYEHDKEQDKDYIQGIRGAICNELRRSSFLRAWYIPSELIDFGTTTYTMGSGGLDATDTSKARNIECELKDGYLDIKVPIKKIEEKKPTVRQIAIKAAEQPTEEVPTDEQLVASLVKLIAECKNPKVNDDDSIFTADDAIEIIRNRHTHNREGYGNITSVILPIRKDFRDVNAHAIEAAIDERLNKENKKKIKVK